MEKLELELSTLEDLSAYASSIMSLNKTNANLIIVQVHDDICMGGVYAS